MMAHHCHHQITRPLMVRLIVLLVTHPPLAHPMEVWLTMRPLAQVLGTLVAMRSLLAQLPRMELLVHQSHSLFAGVHMPDGAKMLARAANYLAIIRTADGAECRRQQHGSYAKSEVGASVPNIFRLN